MRINPLSVFVTVILTPGSTAPVVSRTVPEIAAEKPCPNNEQPAKAINTRIPASSFLLTITPPFSLNVVVRVYVLMKKRRIEVGQVRNGVGKFLVKSYSKATLVSSPRQEFEIRGLTLSLAKC